MLRWRPSNRFLSSSNLLFATGRSQPIRIPSPHSPESRPDFNAVTSRTWFSSSATEEYNHAGHRLSRPPKNGHHQARTLLSEECQFRKSRAFLIEHLGCRRAPRRICSRGSLDAINRESDDPNRAVTSTIVLREPVRQIVARAVVVADCCKAN